MKQSVVGVILLAFGISLFVNFFAFYSYSGQTERENNVKESYEKALTEAQLDNERLSQFIDSHTSTQLEQQAKEKEELTTMLTLLYTYTPDTRDSRFDKLEKSVSSQVMDTLNPPIETMDGNHLSEEEFNPYGENVSANDQKETVSISDISLFAKGNGEYVATYTLDFSFPTSDSITQTCLTLLTISEGIVTSWQQSTTEFLL